MSILVSVSRAAGLLRAVHPERRQGRSGRPGQLGGDADPAVRQGFEGNLGYASALSIVLFFVTVIPMLVLARINRRGGRMSIVTDPARPDGGTGCARYAGGRPDGVVRLQHVSPTEKMVRYVLLVFVLLITIGPFLWQLSTSLKGSGEDIYTRIPRLLRPDRRCDNYSGVADTIPVLGLHAATRCIVAVLVVGGNIVGLVAGRFRDLAVEVPGPAGWCSGCSWRRWCCRVRSRSFRST